MAEKTADYFADLYAVDPETYLQESAPPMDYREMARQAAAEAGIPVDLFLRLVQQESAFDPNARSPAGAYGLAQLMPDTAKYLGVDPRDPMANLTGGARYLKEQYDKFGDWDLALAAYNSGPGNVIKYGGIPPFPETQNYVKKVGMGGAPQGGPVPGMDGYSYGTPETPPSSPPVGPGFADAPPASPGPFNGLFDGIFGGGRTDAEKANVFKALGVFGREMQPGPIAPPQMRGPGESYNYQRPESMYGPALMALLQQGRK